MTTQAWRAKLRERLTRNVHPPNNEQACWWWARRLDRKGYGLINVWVPGCGRVMTLKAHIVLWLLDNEPEHTAGGDDLYLAYKELTISGLQLDHMRCETACISPDHTQLVTGKENMAFRIVRNRARLAVSA